MRILAVVVFALWAGNAQAQSVRTATQVFAATAAADWATTATFLSSGQGSEGNVLLKWTGDRPGLTVTAGVAMDVGAVYAWNRYVGRKHPKLATVGLFAVAAYRGWLVSRGVKLLNGGRL